MKSGANQTIVIANDLPTIISRYNHKDLWIRFDELAKATGFEVKPEGACHGDLCIPLSDEEKHQCFRNRSDGMWFNYSGLASKLGQALVHDEDEGVWSLGGIPEKRRNTLESGIAPDFEIRDRAGKRIRLSDFRGKKVLLLTWASW